MPKILASVSAVLFSGFLLLCGNGLLGTLLGIRLSIADVNPHVIGVVMASYFAGLLIGAYYGDRLIRLVGHIRAFAALASIFSAATLAHGFLFDSALWAILRFIEGLSIAGLFMCMESWLNDRAPNALRGRIMSCYMIVIYTGLGIGQFLLLLRDPEGFALFALASVILSIALVPIALTRFPAPEAPNPQPFGLKKLMAISPLGVVGALISGILMGAIYGLGPTYTHAIGMDTEGTVRFMAIVLLGGLILQWPVGRLSDFLDRRIVLAITGLAVTATSIVLVLTGERGEYYFLSSSLLFGGAIYLIYPLSVTHANDFIPPEDLVSASGGLLVAYSFGATLGPLLGSIGIDIWGPKGLFFLTACASTVMTVFALIRIVAHRRIPQEHETKFAMVPRTTPMAAELDSRGDEETDTPEITPPN
jgi:MFS family permease